MTRDERQNLAIKKWKENKYRGTFEFCTGFGKTYTAIKAIKLFLDKNPGRSILVVVPTEFLKQQWLQELVKNGLFMNVNVMIINSLIKVTSLKVDMLIIDEIHRVGAATFSKVFTVVKFKLIIGLTATLERLDGKHTIIQQYCPIIDIVTVQEAIEAKWLAKYVEYKVILDVNDLEEYKIHNEKFTKYFEFFGNDFDLAMACAAGTKKGTGIQYRNWYLNSICTSSDPETRKKVKKSIEINAFGFIRELRVRKEFILNHPKKIDITNLILSYRQESKAITFSPTLKIAGKLKYGKVLSSKETKTKNRITKEDFMQIETGALHTSKMVNEGADIPGVNLLIILSNTSSSTEKTQRIGRGIRTDNNPDKECEVFTLVLRGTAEEAWFTKSNTGREFITIDEENLLKVLKGEEYETERNKTKTFLYRF